MKTKASAVEQLVKLIEYGGEPKDLEEWRDMRLSEKYFVEEKSNPSES